MITRPFKSSMSRRPQVFNPRPVGLSSHRSRQMKVYAQAHKRLARKQYGKEFVDYYDLMGVEPTAQADEIKGAYRDLQKMCHPDVCGEDGHEMCVILNDAYDVLSTPKARKNYDAARVVAKQDEEEGYTGLTKSKWCSKDEEETRAVFVDENACIGCRACIYHAAATFRVDDDAYGRAHVFAQWLNDEETIQIAMDACPVSCIHWVDREELPVLEHVMAKLPRVDVAAMMMSSSSAPADPFAAAETFYRKRADLIRKRKLEREGMANAKRRNTTYYATAEATDKSDKLKVVERVREMARKAANGECKVDVDDLDREPIALLPAPGTTSS
ncbi:hypothetical protein PPROV_000914200 [Pycnococcus provasolii]|uniref:J domain-containing protein n=1 Tax=Pycnococcus provasolii TaxID=41880 RepID=A0A830HYA1_9CHLO|nr:hypothetical protein PPROV_000914200 [Pycnococcus provasolii]